MDPGPANPKRKRGRPSAAIATRSEPPEERVSKRKRAESFKQTAAEPLAGVKGRVLEDSLSRKKRRGRPSNISVAERTQDEDEGEEPSSSRATRKERVYYAEKRKYNSGSQENLEEPRGSREKKRVDYGEKRKYSSGNQEKEPSSRDALKKKQQQVNKDSSMPLDQEVQPMGRVSRHAGQKSQASQAEATEQEGEQLDPKSAGASKRKRAARSKTSAASQEEPDRPVKKRGRPSLTSGDQIATANAQSISSSQSKRRRNVSKTNNNSQEDQQNLSESRPLKKRRGRPSNANTTTSSKTVLENSQIRESKVTSREKHVSMPEEAHKRKKRRRSSPDPEEEEIEQPTEIAHQRLVPKEHKINRDIIDSKWNSLPSGAISRVSSVLNEAQRPVMHRLHNEQTRAQVQAAISTIIRKVERKLTKGFPFPPSIRASHREEDFDLEKILKHNRNLETQLTVLHHSNDLLIADRKKEEALLAKDKDRLDKLEASVKEETNFNKAESRKSDHRLLKKSTAGDEKDEIALTNKPRVDLSDLHQDEDLAPIIKQMHEHLDSMQGNMEQVRDIGSAIAETKAAVQDVLVGHIDVAQYERVVLG